MSKSNTFQNFFSQNDFAKAFEQYQGLPFDMGSVLETQRKNIQAVADAQQLAFENLQAIAQRQSEILSQILEDNASLAQQIMAEGTPEEKMAKNADLFKKVYERSIKSLKELSDMVGKSNDEASKIINQRVTASMTEIKSALEKAQSEKKAA